MIRLCVEYEMLSQNYAGRSGSGIGRVNMLSCVYVTVCASRVCADKRVYLVSAIVIPRLREYPPRASVDA